MVKKNSKTVILFGVLLFLIVGVATAIYFYPITTTPTADKGPILNWICSGPVNEAVKAANNEWSKAGGLRDQAITANNKVWVGNEQACLANLSDPKILAKCGGRVRDIANVASNNRDSEWTKSGGFKEQAIIANNKDWVGTSNPDCLNNLDNAQYLISNCGGRVGNVVKANTTLWEAEVAKSATQLKKIKDEIKYKQMFPTSAYNVVIPFYIAGKPDYYIFFDSPTEVNYILVGAGGAGADGTIKGAGGGGGEGGEIITGKTILDGFYKVTVGKGGGNSYDETSTKLEKYIDVPHFKISYFENILTASGGSNAPNASIVDVSPPTRTYASDAPGGKGGGKGGAYSYVMKGVDGMYSMNNKIPANVERLSGGGNGGSKTIPGYTVPDAVTNGGKGATQTIRDIDNKDVNYYANGGDGGGGSYSNTGGKGGQGTTITRNGQVYGKGGDGAKEDCTVKATDGNPGLWGGGGGGGGGGTASCPPGKGGFGGDGVAFIFY